MNSRHLRNATMKNTKRRTFERRLAAYVGATAPCALLASEASGVVVSNSTVQPFGINSETNIDFNNDGQIDFQLDHDRVDLNGTILDYLQIDKNDVNSETNPYPSDGFAVFPVPDGQVGNWDHGYLTAPDIPGDLGYYPAALLSGAEIGPLGNWDFQEGDNFLGTNLTIRANRLIDEDAGQIDAANPSPPPGNLGQQVPFGAPGWVGLNGEVRYLGLRLDLNDAGFPGNEFPGGNGPEPDDANYWYGWVGVRITNEADATGEVVGYGYETELGMPIMAGAVAPSVAGDYNGNGTVDAADYVVWKDNLGLMGGATASQGDGTGDGNVTSADYDFWMARFGNTSGAGSGLAPVPEPSTLLLGILTGFAMIGSLLWRRIRRW
jgi:hypothetical protein